MSELEMKNDIETEEFTDELSDEALDRERGGSKYSQGANNPSGISGYIDD
jgi:hypothetical protein